MRPLARRPGEDGIALPPLAVAGLLGAGALFVTALVLLLMMLATIRSLDERIVETNARIGALRTDIRPPTEQAPGFLRDSRAFFDRVDAALTTTTATLPALDLAVRSLAGDAGPAMRDLRRADLGVALASIRFALTDLARLTGNHTFARTFEALDALLARAARLDTLGALDRNLGSLPRITSSLAAMQRDLDALARIEGSLGQIGGSLDYMPRLERSLLSMQESLRELLVHVRSLDAKTGGTFPPGQGTKAPSGR